MPDEQESILEDDASPFHAGEQEVQQRLGVRYKAELIGRSAMHDFLPDKQRQFFSQLPMLLVGSVDAEGWPWASVLFGRPGFVATPDERTIAADAAPVAGDPLDENLAPGARVGLLGIELPTRRRNRVNATVSRRLAGKDPDESGGFEARIDQFFGNCPKYIQAREPSFVERIDQPTSSRGKTFRDLGDAERSLLRRADTLFVASSVGAQQRRGFLGETGGVDVNHRGGRPGFIKVEGRTLTIPDYIGNNLYNTLGNFVLNPKAGIVVPDYQTGDLLQLVGETEILWDGHEEIAQFEGAHRAWRLHVDHGHWLHGASPLTWGPEELGPGTAKTGVW